MLLSIVSRQGLDQILLRVLAIPVAHARQDQRIVLSPHDRMQNCQACLPGQITQHLAQLEVHLQQGFLHVLNVLGAIFKQIITMAQVGPQ
jgi:hypothetical protein